MHGKGAQYNHCNNSDQNALRSTISHGDLEKFLKLNIPTQDRNAMKIIDVIKKLNKKKYE